MSYVPPVIPYVPPNPPYAPPSNGNNNSTGAIPVYIVAGVTGGGYTPKAALATAIVTNGVAITVVTGPINGGFVANPLNAAAQGLGAVENAYLDMVGTPGSTDATAIGTTYLLSPGQSFNLPALASGVNVKINAATAGHKFTVNVW